MNDGTLILIWAESTYPELHKFATLAWTAVTITVWTDQKPHCDMSFRHDRRDICPDQSGIAMQSGWKTVEYLCAVSLTAGGVYMSK